MKTYSAADVAATSPEQLAQLREGPAQDYAAWIRAAAELGLVEAQTIYGQMLLDGVGVARQPEEGLVWFKRAANADNVMAINMVGRCYENGWGVPADDTVAAYWFRLAADRGLDWGLYNYAHMLRSGRGGVTQNKAAALALYQQAAQMGHVKSIGVVGRFYEAGDVVEQDMARAFDCYQRCAEGGDFRGMFHLGRLLLLQGRKEEAVQWLARVPETSTAAFLKEANGMLQDCGFPALYEG